METTVLSQAVRSSWSAETSYIEDEWNSENPARGQCAVTSLVVQDYMGGDILRARTFCGNQRESHFYNCMEDGTTVDLTAEQYPTEQAFEEAPLDRDRYESMRAKLLSDPTTAQKYAVFSQFVQRALLAAAQNY